MIAFGVVLSLIALASGASLGKHNAHPYQVSFREWVHPDPQDEYVHFCSGVILNEEWILSAASCFEERDLGFAWAAVGTEDIADEGQKYEIAFAVFPEDYDTPYADNLALIRIAGKLEFNENVKAIALPTSDYNDYSRNGEIVGWFTRKIDLSVSKTLQTVFLPVISNEECSQSRDVTASHICVDDKKDFCHEDIGAPLVVDNVLVGIESYVAPCAGALPDVFTRVFSYKNWILEAFEKYA